jgi:hypothetical protein
MYKRLKHTFEISASLGRNIKFCITATCLLAHSVVIVTSREQCHVLNNPIVFVLKGAGSP